MKKRTLPTLIILVFLNTFLYSQKTTSSIWTVSNPEQLDREALSIPASQYELYQLDMPALKAVLSECVKKENLQSKSDYIEIEIPLFGQDLQRFGMFEAPVMEAGLQNKYPEIRTYTGQGIDNPRQIIKLDVGPKGFHAMIFSNKQTFVIEPAFENDLNQYMVFQKQDVLSESEEDIFRCHVAEKEVPSLTDKSVESVDFTPTGPELRTYRLALATTGEYSIYHGGTKPLVLAAMATVMNRVNGIYEKDLTITMIMINNTDTLIYLDPATDPYTNNDGGTMLGQNNSTCNAIIGFANYDIGHVFSTGGGGIAGLGVVCGSNKGFGVTGLGSPIGDVFSVDYVAHEMGHQFDGNHTYNSCGQQGPQPYEPGSGVTVMAYAGICGNTNIADNSIDQFHVASFDEIIAFSQSGDGNGCAVVTETDNTAPTVDAGIGGFYIPHQTPFELTGSATDLEGDSLTYCWEQYDLGPNTHPDVAAGTAPLFRPWKPVDHGTRIFPKIEDLVNNVHTIGELLPQFGREMNFRMTVRDNVAGGGGVDYDQLTFQVANDSGPFEIIEPNGGQTWAAGYLEAVSWAVANSDLSPVNCSEVNIWLSEDGGYTYPHLVASNLPNNGYAVIQVPNIVGNQIRLKVKAADNVFFDISNQNFTIEPTTTPDFVFISNTPSQTICGNETVDYDIILDTILGYSNPINLSILDNPAGTNVSFSANDVIPPGNVTISVNTTAGVVAGDYTITLLLTDDAGIKELPLTLKIRDGAPSAATLLAPINGAADLPGSTVLSWDPLPLADTYTIEIALSADFSNIIYTESGITGTTYDPTPNLSNNTIYFWRVRAHEETCGTGVWSSIFSFQTIITGCSTYTSTDVPLDIPSPGTLISELTVPDDFVLTDVNVIGLTGDHNRVGQLLFRLRNPGGNTVLLFGGICGNDNDFNLGLDDDGFPTPIPCPPTTGLSYQPTGDLADFNGSNAMGTWELEVQDLVNQTSGDLLSWSLELCSPPANTEPPSLDLQGDVVLIGGTLVIETNNISGDCLGSTTDLTYTITGLPSSGILLLGGIEVAVGTTFTQSDIDNDLLTYVNDGNDLDADQFEFIMTCTDGTYLGGQVFNITVVLMINTNELSNVSFSIYPNPAADYFEIQLGQAVSAPYEIEVVNLLGRVIQKQRILSETTRITTGMLSAGVYSCQLVLDGVVLGEQKLVVMR